MNVKRGTLGIVACTLALTGCRVGPNYRRPNIPLPVAFDGSVPPPLNETQEPAIAGRKWEEIFKDPALSALVVEALKSNLDLKMAAQRILEAQAYLGEVRADQYPYLSGGVGYSAIHLPAGLASSLNGNQFFRGGGPNASAVWNADFWGLYRRQTEAARADMLANVWAQRAVQVAILQSVAEAYFNLRSLDEQLETTKQTIAAREASTKLVESLEKGGFSSAEDLKQAEISLHEAKANLPSLRAGIAIQEHLISLLLGKPPTQIARGLTISEQPHLAQVPTGLPSELLERRPDIQEAEQKLVAANARIGVAKARYFPNISLTGLGGSSSNQLNQIFSTPAGYWGATGALTEPIFDAGKIRSENRFARAQEQEMLQAYQRQILDALREVSDALVLSTETKARREELERQVSSAAEALRLANLRYNGGDTSYLEVLTVQTDLYNAQLSLTRSRKDEAASLLKVYTALGGGWS